MLRSAMLLVLSGMAAAPAIGQLSDDREIGLQVEQQRLQSDIHSLEDRLYRLEHPQSPQPSVLEGVDLGALLPGSVPTKGLATRRPQAPIVGQRIKHDLLGPENAAPRPGQGSDLAEYEMVQGILASNPAYSPDGRGLASRKPDDWTMAEAVNVLWDAIKSEMFTYGSAKWMFGDSHKPDPAFRWTPESIAEYTDGVGEEQVDYILEAESAEEARIRRARLDDVLESRANLARLGTFGSALGLAAGIFSVTCLWLLGSLYFRFRRKHRR